MSSRACRLAAPRLVQAFQWSDATSAPDPDLWTDLTAPAVADDRARPTEPTLTLVGARPDHSGPHLADEPTAADEQARLAIVEREAFAKGYAQGERAGVEAGAERAEAMLRRLAQTIDQIAELRSTMVRETERQMVQLAITLAERVVRRELSLDPDLVAALAHVALDRLGDSSPATIRLHPDDYATVMASRSADWAGTQVSVVPDAAVARGGCLVDSTFGLVDGSVGAQLAELERALIGDAEGPTQVGGADAA